MEHIIATAQRSILSATLLVVLCIGPAQQTVLSQTASVLQTVNTADTFGNTVTAKVYKIGKAHFVYTGGDNGFLDVFRIGEGGKLAPVERFELSNGKGPARGIVADKIGGTDYLFVGNKGASSVEVLSIADDGRLKRVFVMDDTEKTYLGTVITLQVVHMAARSYLFVGGLEATPGLSSFEIKADGKLVHVLSVADDETLFTDGIIGMFTHKIKGRTFLITGGFMDNGVSSFRVFADGSFENINNIADNTTDRYLTGAYPVDGVTLGENHYIIVGHRHHKYYKRGNFIKKKDFIYHGDGVSVFKVSDLGELIPHFVLTDDEKTKVSGQTRIEVLKLDDTRAIVAVGTRDDQSIQICELTADGTLSPLGATDVDYPIYYGMASAIVGGDLYFLAGSVDNAVKKFFSYRFDLPGISRGDHKSDRVLRHVVSLKYKDETTREQVEEAVREFTDLQHKIPAIIGLEWGKNNSPEGKSKNFTHCFTLTFKDEKGREEYLVHAAHLALVERVGPLLADVFVMDYWGKR